MKEVAISELKAKLSEYIAMARRGIRLVVTDRGKPVAEISQFGSLLKPGPKNDDFVIRRLAQSGALQLPQASGPLSPISRKLQFEGSPFSDQISEDRGG